MSKTVDIFINPKIGDKVIALCSCRECLKKHKVFFVSGGTISEVVLCRHGKLSEVIIDFKVNGKHAFLPSGKSVDKKMRHLLVAPATKKNKRRLYEIGADKIIQRTNASRS